MPTLKLQIPDALGFLFEPSRYKVAYGGRGGGKSWGFVRALIVKALESPKRILCAREIQNSIKESVHQLIKSQIHQLKLLDVFTVKDTVISCNNGSEFIFEGLRHNVDNIRSKEGIDICAVFEAKNVSKSSWEVLIPTIRKEGSEIWVEFNPELDTDETYRRFVLRPPSDAIVRKVNWSHNPWFPRVLVMEKDDLAASDPDAYLNVWEGHCRVTLEGAIYANEIRDATAQGRITRVPYDESAPVHTFWDLGWADCTSIWFAQKVGFDYMLIDFYQNQFQKLGHYLQVLQQKPYIYGNDYLPHDANNESVAAQSIAKTMKEMGRKPIVVPRVTDKKLGLKATREIFGRCWFDEERCQDGLQALRRYRYEKNERGQYAMTPAHDEYSHAADAFEQFARSINRKHDSIKQAPQAQVIQLGKTSGASQSWMG